MTPIDFGLLSIQFPEEDIEWRIAQAGRSASGQLWAKALAYVTNRAIMERLDSVVGPARWRNQFVHVNGGVMCGLSLEVSEGQWVEKWDGSDPTDFEAYKGGISAAMKRSAVQWGIGRYLYNLGESWANILDDRAKGCYHATPTIRNKGGQEEKVSFYWSPPPLPAWALPPKRTITVIDSKTFNEWIKPIIGAGQISAENVRAIVEQNNKDYTAAAKEITGCLEMLKS